MENQLADYAGKKLVVFIQKRIRRDVLPACDLRDNFDRFHNNYELLGVSADAAKAQAKFKRQIISPLMRISPLLKLWRLGT
jgi:peroxiredoxin Q/BCP